MELEEESCWFSSPCLLNPASCNIQEAESAVQGDDDYYFSLLAPSVASLIRQKVGGGRLGMGFLEERSWKHQEKV